MTHERSAITLTGSPEKTMIQAAGTRDFGEAPAERLRDIPAAEPTEHPNPRRLAEWTRLEERGLRELAGQDSDAYVMS